MATFASAKNGGDGGDCTRVIKKLLAAVYKFSLIGFSQKLKSGKKLLAVVFINFNK